ncbi:hypothetical protein [Staphylococcus arlettae]|nr:hypothetical protein [Staphylococcus arlettae]
MEINGVSTPIFIIAISVISVIVYYLLVKYDFNLVKHKSFTD